MLRKPMRTGFLCLVVLFAVIAIGATDSLALLITDVSPTTYTGPLGGQAGPIMGSIEHDSAATYFVLAALLTFGPPEFNGTTVFALVNVPSPIPDPGDQYTGALGSLVLSPFGPFAVGTYHGTFEMIATIFPVGCTQLSCTTHETATWPDPITINVTPPAGVPEPATWVLVVSGLAGIASRAWRRGQRSSVP